MADRHTTIRASQLRNLSITGEDIAYASISGSTKLIDSSVSESKLDISNNPVDGYYLKYTTASGMEWFAGSGGTTDHGALTGLADDDHSQYLLADGTRALTSVWNYGSQTISGTGDIYTSGKVGIGTTSPGKTLEVNGTVSGTYFYGDGSNLTGLTLDIILNADIDTGTETVDTFADTAGDGCIWHFMIKNGTNLRAGDIISCWESSANIVEYTETSTNDIGDTSDLTLTVDIDSNNVRLRATASSDDWQVKVIRMLM